VDSFLRAQDSNQSQIEKGKNEIISRRDDDSVPLGTVRRSNEEISHFFSSRSGRSVCKSSSALLVAYVPKGTQRSSRLESNPHTLRSTDSGLNPALWVWYVPRRRPGLPIYKGVLFNNE